MQKWSIYRLLVILMVLIQNKAAAQDLKLLRTTSFLHFASSSSMQYYNKRLYVLGDDAPQLLVLNKNHQIRDSLRLFSNKELRISKENKADIEASFLVQKNQEVHLFAVSSFSGTMRNYVLRIRLDGKKMQKDFETFLVALDVGPMALNIEGAVAVGSRVILSNRANRTHTNNSLLLFELDDQKGFTSKIVNSISIQLPASKEVIGISGLDYIQEKDLLLFTASTELTDNAMDDGEIGKSYLGYITQFSKKLQQEEIKVSQFLDLETILRTEKSQKIESVTVQKWKRKKAILHLAADNDDGSSRLFKIRFGLPSTQ